VVDLSSSEVRQLSAHDRVVLRQKRPPRAVAEMINHSGRPDDIREEQGEKRAAVVVAPVPRGRQSVNHVSGIQDTESAGQQSGERFVVPTVGARQADDDNADRGIRRSTRSCRGVHRADEALVADRCYKRRAPGLFHLRRIRRFEMRHEPPRYQKQTVDIRPRPA